MSDTIVVTTEVPVTVEVAGPQGPQGAAGTVTYGTTANTACEGNDARIATIGSGTIDTVGDLGIGGSINTGQTGSGSGSPGDIDTGTTGDGVGGFIKTSAVNSDGGYIDTRGYGSGSGGFINTSNNGGSISTYEGGGSISTRGTGSIELGVTGTRTTLVGSAATTNKTVTLPNATGTVALTQQATDIEITDPTKGYILNSATKRWRLTIDDNGVLLRTALTLLFSLSFMCGAKAQVRDLVYGTNNVVVGPTNSAALSFTNTVLFSNALTLPQATGLSSSTAKGIQWRSIYPSSNGLIALSGTDDQGQTTFRISTGTMSGTTEEIALFNANAVTFYKPLGFNNTTNAAATRTNLGVTVASNLPALYSGAATTNSLLVADGAGSSAFVSTIPKLTIASGTITNSNPALSISQTWSNTNVAFTGLLVNITNTASSNTSTLADFQVAGSSRQLTYAAGDLVTEFGSGTAGRNHQIQIWGNGVGRNHIISAATQTGLSFRLTSTGTETAAIITSTSNPGIRLSSASSFHWTTGVGAVSGTPDLFLYRDAAGVLAQYNGTNPQTYNIYNTYSNSTNYERGFMRWSNNLLQIGTEKAGTGSQRNMQFWVDGNATFSVFNDQVQLTSGSQLWWFSRLILRSDADGQLRLMNWAQNGFDRLMFGGTTTNFPALKRTNTVLQVRLADDSAYTTLDAQHRLQGTAPTNSTDTGTAGDIRYDTNNYIYICVSNNVWRRTSLTNW